MSYEAALFGRYVIGRPISRRAVELYDAALRELNYGDEDRVVSFACAHPWALGPLDAVLALTQPGATLRRKLLVMAAILETQPEYSDAFLPNERPITGLLATGYAVMRHALLSALGLLLLPWTR